MNEKKGRDWSAACAVPHRHDTVQLAHGGGGRIMQELLDSLVVPSLLHHPEQERTDSACLTLGDTRLAFTTDSFVITPRFFPGGDLGELAVYGTVNDLACAGAVPKFLSCSLVLEEGLAMEELARVLASMRAAADRCNVQIVTGDTKVVDRGHGDGVFINTAGIGLLHPNVDLRPERVRPGDAIFVSGDLGRHGIAVMSLRHGIAFGTEVTSDCGPIHVLSTALLEAELDVACLRDPTRGGLAAVLNEIASGAKVEIEIDEPQVPVSEGVRSACEMLGLDPLYVACEGRLVGFVREEHAEAALGILRQLPGGEEAALIGQVAKEGAAGVVLQTALGTRRALAVPSGEQLPRIC